MGDRFEKWAMLICYGLAIVGLTAAWMHHDDPPYGSPQYNCCPR